jgi:flagellar basal-body rod protein FlgG
MNGAFYIGAIALDAQQQALDAISNNVANINTTAYKRQVVHFSELVGPARPTADSALTQDTVGMTPAGVMVSGTPRVWTQGTLTQTGQPLDLAIQGDGFIDVLGPGGQDMLWRGGTLAINADGNLATSDGNDLRAMINVPLGAQNLTIGTNGIVSATVNGTTQQIGQLEVAMVKNPADLIDVGGGYFEAPEASDVYAVQPGSEGSGTLVQGSLETSNVQLTDEMTSVLLAQRAYGASAQVVQAGDQLMAIANGLRR